MVSVIIPNYNHAPYLLQRIDSVLNQTFHDFEVIILDDCSTDDSREIIEHYRYNDKVTQIVYNDVNSGSTFRQWEKGINLAKGQYIWIAESDDYVENTFLETAITNIRAKGTSLFYCQSYGVDESSKISGDYLWWTEEFNSINWLEPFNKNGEDFIVQALQYKNVILNASAVVFKKLNFDFDKVVKYKTCGDWLFWINILNKATLSYSPRKLNYFRSHSNTTRNLSSKPKFVLRLMEELAIKYEIYKLKLINKNQFRRYLTDTIDQLIPYYDMFKENCNQLGLPHIFIYKFIIRKVELKIKRLSFN